MKQGYWMLSPIEVKSVLLFPFRGEREFGKQKYKIAQCQSREITLWKYVDIVRIPFILMTIDMSSSSRIEKLPSSYTYYSAEWKVLHQKNKNKKKKKAKKANVHFLHLVNFTELRPLYIRYYSVSSGEICQNCIAGIGLFNPSRSCSFFSWFCLGYLSPLNVSW